MPIETDLNISPYFDDYDESKDYHRVLFKPAVPLQARELTQLQSMLQMQVERFGDYQFKEGTIVKGCAFSFDNSVKYVKVLDRSPDTNLNVQLEAYGEHDFIRHDTSNLVSQIVDTRAGLEAQNPDLGALFLHYINTGNNSGDVKTKYANSDVLTIIPKKTSINAISVSAGGGSFDVGDKIYVTSLNANGTGFVGTVATVSSNAIASITVDNDSTAGRNKGAGYSLLDYPYVSEIKRGDAAVWTTTSDSGNGVLVGTYANGHSNTITLPVALQQEAQVTVAGSTFTAPVGSSYQMRVEDGIVYQKGAFQRFEAQSVIVSPFTKKPDGVSVGIITEEVIANSSVDTSLLDNASGFNNENAPGADRLSLTPKLTVNTTAIVNASNNFLSFVEYQNGLIVRKNSDPVLNKSEDHIAQRTYEESGDYVLEPIRVNTETNAGNTTHLNVLVGEGTSYVRGKRFETISTTRYPVPRATQTTNVAAHAVTTNFGHYVKVNELSGHFGSDTQANVVILDTAVDSISGGMGTITSNATHMIADGQGSRIIGHAKIRALELESDNAGHADSVYQAYLYDIKMDSGQTFRTAKAIGQVATKKGIADIVLQGNPAIAKILDASFSKSVFSIGAKALKGVKGTASMTVKKLHEVAIDSTDSNTAITAASGNRFNFGTGSGSLNETQEQQVLIISKSNVTAANVSTAAVVTNSNTTITGCVDTTSIIKGDNVKIGSVFRQVTQVINSTAIVVNEAVGSGSSLGLARAYVNNQIIPLSGRDSANVQVSNAGATLTINFGTGSLSGAVNVDVLVDEVDPSSAGLTKTVQTSTVRINPSSNTTGPWCLGIPDGLSLKSVQVNGSSAYSDQGADVKSDFVLDNGQKDGKYGLSYLKLAPNTSRTIASTDRIIVVLKHFNKSNAAGDGFFSIRSYDGILNDKEGAGVTATDTNISIAQIPVFESPTNGSEISLRDAIDFRPYVANTATKGVAVSNTAGTENPSATEVLDQTGLVSPTPNDEWVDEIEYYLPRKDRVVIDQTGTRVVLGKPELLPELPVKPSKSMQLATIDVPAYPSLDSTLARFYGRPDLGAKVNASQQKRYTMRDIAKLEDRIDNLEYYSSLNALESLTVDQTIPGRADASTNRFKNGFLVDNFTTKTAGNPLNGEYKAGFDTARSMLTSKFERYDIDLEPVLANSARSTFQNDVATIQYGTTQLVNQPTATGQRRCTSMFWEYNGTLTLYPDYIYKSSKTKSPELAMNIDIDLAAPTLALLDELNKMVPELGTTTEVISETTSRGKQLTSNLSGNIRTTVYENIVTTKSQVTTNSLTGSSFKTSKKVGDFVTDISFQPYMPAAQIRFQATGLRMDLDHHIYFDGVNVDAHAYSADYPTDAVSTKTAKDKIHRQGLKGGTLRSDSKGRLAGVLEIPGGIFFTGKAKVVIADIDNLSKIGEKVSSASAQFNSFNWSVDTAELGVTTRHPLLSGGSSSQIINTKTRDGEQIVETDETPPASNNSANTTPPESNTVVTDPISNGSANNVTIPGDPDPVTGPPANSGPSIGRCEIIKPCDDYYVDRYHHGEMGAYGHGYHYHKHDPLCCFDTMHKHVDPLCQTFLVGQNGLPEGSKTGFLSHVDLFFADKDPNTGVVVELRHTQNGVPAPQVLPFSRIHLESADINTSTTGSTKTRVFFDSPVGVEAGKEYAIVILPDGNSPNYSVFTSKTGGTDLVNTASQVNNDWGQGTMFLSTNNRTWTEYLDEDMKFSVFACVFTSNKSKVQFQNADYEFLTLESGNTISGEFVEGAEVFKLGTAKAGNLTYSTTSTSVTGSGTSFSTHYAAGDRIVLQANATGSGSSTYDIVTVKSIASATSMTLEGTPNHSSKAASKGMITPSGIFEYLDPVTKTSQINFSTASSSAFRFANNDILYQAGNYEGSTVPNFKIGTVADTNISRFQPMIGRLQPEQTTIVSSIKGAKISDNSYSILDEIKVNDTNYPIAPIKVMSKSNEIEFNSGNKSLIVEHILSTDNASVSPEIDFQSQGIKIFENSLNNSDTNEWQTFKGQASSKYVSRTITLAKDLDAEDLKVFVNAYSPKGTEIKVYAKLLNESDTTSIDDSYWSELDCTDNKNKRSSAVDRSDVVEYTYEIKDTPIATLQTGQAITHSNTTITGSGTNFDGDYTVGDSIKINNLDDKFDYQVNKITAIASDTSMTVAEPMSFSNIGTTHEKLSAQGKVTAFRDPKAPIAYQASYYNGDGERFVGYNRMSIKIVMLSDDNTKSPALQDYRAIALSL